MSVIATLDPSVALNTSMDSSARYSADLGDDDEGLSEAPPGEDDALRTRTPPPGRTPTRVNDAGEAAPKTPRRRLRCRWTVLAAASGRPKRATRQETARGAADATPTIAPPFGCISPCLEETSVASRRRAGTLSPAPRGKKSLRVRTAATRRASRLDRIERALATSLD